ncbi:lengsin-like [Haliotis rufescens]|uniref:lengsin-like n=1 Tax=Haliotis rufescens TaxID=6454 RepID=UPI00201F2A37|nr:lengsin-like [Haliotis rufescens]
MYNFEEVEQEIAKYDYVRFSICDLNGSSRGQAIARRHVRTYLEKGLDMFQGVLALGPQSEFVGIEHEENFNFGNVLIVPDPATLRSIPWAPEGVKVAEMLCESRWKKDNSPQEACPRYSARKQLQRLDDLGLSFYSGNEIEFQLLEKNTLEPVFNYNSYLSQRLLNKNSEVIFHFDKNFQESDIDVERFHVELGPGFFEAVTKPKYGIESADEAFNLQEGLLEMADQKGLRATFMSYLSSKDKMGIATHFNFSLWNKSGENVFYEAGAPDKLSVIAKQWIAGILKHSKALSAFTNPTINCYRNFINPFKPMTANWGIEDRQSCLRIKNEDPYKTYIENRLPRGKSNIYLVMASTIAAGLDGVEKKMECPVPGKQDDAESLPCSLAEALRELERDEDLCNALGKELVTWFVKSKRDAEIAKYEGIETDEERFAVEKEDYL